MADVPPSKRITPQDPHPVDLSAGGGDNPFDLLRGAAERDDAEAFNAALDKIIAPRRTHTDGYMYDHDTDRVAQYSQIAEAVRIAAKNGSINVTRALHQRRFNNWAEQDRQEIFNSAFNQACRSGQAEIAKFYLEYTVIPPHQITWGWYRARQMELHVPFLFLQGHITEDDDLKAIMREQDQSREEASKGNADYFTPEKIDKIDPKNADFVFTELASIALRGGHDALFATLLPHVRPNPGKSLSDTIKPYNLVVLGRVAGQLGRSDHVATIAERTENYQHKNLIRRAAFEATIEEGHLDAAEAIIRRVETDRDRILAPVLERAAQQEQTEILNRFLPLTTIHTISTRPPEKLWDKLIGIAFEQDSGEVEAVLAVHATEKLLSADNMVRAANSNKRERFDRLLKYTPADQRTYQGNVHIAIDRLIKGKQPDNHYIGALFQRAEEIVQLQVIRDIVTLGRVGAFQSLLDQGLLKQKHVESAFLYALSSNKAAIAEHLWESASEDTKKEALSHVLANGSEGSEEHVVRLMNEVDIEPDHIVASVATAMSNGRGQIAVSAIEHDKFPKDRATETLRKALNFIEDKAREPNNFEAARLALAGHEADMRALMLCRAVRNTNPRGVASQIAVITDTDDMTIGAITAIRLMGAKQSGPEVDVVDLFLQHDVIAKLDSSRILHKLMLRDSQIEDIGAPIVAACKGGAIVTKATLSEFFQLRAEPQKRLPHVLQALLDAPGGKVAALGLMYDHPELTSHLVPMMLPTFFSS